MDTKVVADGYILFDTTTGKPERLDVFKRRCDAANSYNAWNRPAWKEQTRIIAKAIRIVDADTGDYFS
jgi:hypothetical protein